MKALGFSNSLVRHLENFDPNSLLGYRCQPPEHCLSSPIITRNIVPLWECGVVLTYFNRNSGLFEQCSLEAIDEVFDSFESVQAVLAALLMEPYEDELPEQGLRKAASEVGFLHIERLIREAESHQGESYIDWCTHFPATCEGEQ